MPNEWEVWWALVKFEDSNQAKTRPVIVLENNQAYILSLKVTSHGPRKNFNGEFDLMKWNEAGLERPSTVRLSQPLKLKEKDFKSKIGDLDAFDIYAIQQLLTYYDFENY
ncbi:type II toxin-antitoxin system PemK/MazF family toxin [Veillonella intestinalis]|uniref:type II toxin-antitoxin system PemK/MazF family toxin n=1 Tax=Veillonella intestinalis TaxID=2941341 RepID=UPI002040F2D2|nr:type II toxin-antitoxin system PemK/MazF family toxin [Veillonella intestinalis]